MSYASSAAVYNPSDPSPAPEAGGTRPATLYGVSKLADEGIARVYRADAGVPSIGLRPYVVYGPGRDQGMTSGPTMAMLAAVRGEPFHIGFSGTAQYDYVPDVARAAVMAAHASTETAGVYNVPGALADVADVVACIQAAVPGAEITWSGDPLPFPPALEAAGFDREVGPFPRTLARRRGGRHRRALPADPGDRLKPVADEVSGFSASRAAERAPVAQRTGPTGSPPRPRARRRTSPSHREPRRG